MNIITLRKTINNKNHFNITSKTYSNFERKTLFVLARYSRLLGR